ncbi:adenosine-specific kinase [Caldisphaera sp.]|uniref:adenosine-specific kinase n=1 Tax=Caldisphaera sp. TaxID=2060322 RepID=UPI0025BFA9E2|nr:adenosine-specific kinase [Caldisphaera sp.]
MEFQVLDIPVPEGTNVIIGRSHFIKTVEDLYETMVTSCPSAKFGIAFCEASGKRLIRYEGNDKDLTKQAIETCNIISSGHVFVIYLKDSWPINVLNAIKSVQEVTSIYVATSNPVKIAIADMGESRLVLGFSDGFKPLGVEKEEDKKERKELLRRFGYKL